MIKVATGILLVSDSIFNMDNHLVEIVEFPIGAMLLIDTSSGLIRAFYRQQPRQEVSADV